MCFTVFFLLKNTKFEKLIDNNYWITIIIIYHNISYIILIKVLGHMVG